jgi:hypothetical protein
MKYLKLFEELNKEIWYHGTGTKFFEFDEPNNLSKPTSKLGIWFSKDKDFSEIFGKHIISVKLYYHNPYIISLSKWDDIRMKHAKNANYFLNLRKKLIDEGYDAFYVKGKKDIFAGQKVETPDVIAVFYSNQIQII